MGAGPLNTAVIHDRHESVDEIRITSVVTSIPTNWMARYRVVLSR